VAHGPHSRKQSTNAQQMCETQRVWGARFRAPAGFYKRTLGPGAEDDANLMLFLSFSPLSLSPHTR